MTNMDSDSVSVIDIATNIVSRTIRLSLVNRCGEAPPRGILPSGIAITPDGTRAYVTTGACFITVLDTVGSRLADQIFPPRNAFVGPSIAITPQGDRAYVTGSQFNGSVLVIDTATNSVTKVLPVGEIPADLAITPDGRFVYVTNEGRFTDPEPDTVSVIDTAEGQVVASVTVGNGPDRVAVAPDGSFAYVINASEGTFSVIDLPANTVAVTVPGGGSDVTISPDSKRAYFTQAVGPPTFEGFVAVIDTPTSAVVGRILVGGRGTATAIALTSSGGFAYVTNAGDDSVSVLDTISNALLATILIPDCGTQSNPRAPCSPRGIAIGEIPGGCAPCAGDCNRDGATTMDELIRGVGVALGELPPDFCDLADSNRDGVVTVDEIVGAVNAALGGKCALSG